MCEIQIQSSRSHSHQTTHRIHRRTRARPNARWRNYGWEIIYANEKVVDALVKTSEGDLRKAITYLQTSAKLFSTPQTTSTDDDVIMTDDDTNQVTISSIEEIAGVVPPS